MSEGMQGEGIEELLIILPSTFLEDMNERAIPAYLT